MYPKKGIACMHWVVILGMNNTPLIAWTKIIQPMVFTEYPFEGIVFLQGLNFAFLGVKKGFFCLSARLE
jgi:hypothetical protein